MILNVNTSSAIKLTAKLEKMHKSAMPSAIRNTLNDVAFEHKRLIPLQAKKLFENSRSPNFFKALTSVNKASGFNVNSMIAVSGLNTGAFSGKTKRIIDNLQSQNDGGKLSINRLTAMDDIRYGNKHSGKIRKESYHDKIDIHDSTQAFHFKRRKGSVKSGFVSAIYSAKKAGKKYMLIKSERKNKSNGMVYYIGNMSSNMKTKKTNYKVRKMFSYHKNRSVTADKKPFITNARTEAMKKIDKFYLKNAEFQFKKFMK